MTREIDFRSRIDDVPSTAGLYVLGIERLVQELAQFSHGRRSRTATQRAPARDRRWAGRADAPKNRLRGVSVR